MVRSYWLTKLNFKIIIRLYYTKVIRRINVPEAGNTVPRTVLIIKLLHRYSIIKSYPQIAVSSSSINRVAVSFVNMIIIKALLLFLLYNGTFGQGESSQACQNITEELNANQACQQAFTTIASTGNGTNVTLSDLETYCAQDCKDIVVGISTECVSYLNCRCVDI